MLFFSSSLAKRTTMRVRRKVSGVCLLALASVAVSNAATWTALTNQAPNGHGTGIMMQLTDGTILMENADDIQTWFKLTPDAFGSYVNGAWTTTNPMNFARLYFGSQVLPNGK